VCLVLFVVEELHFSTFVCDYDGAILVANSPFNKITDC